MLPQLYALKRLIHIHRLSPGFARSALLSGEGVNLFPGLARELNREMIMKEYIADLIFPL
jgi:hypothetical protein